MIPEIILALTITNPASATKNYATETNRHRPIYMNAQRRKIDFSNSTQVLTRIENKNITNIALSLMYVLVDLSAEEKAAYREMIESKSTIVLKSVL